MDFVKVKKKAALLSIFSNSFLILAKFIIGLITGSVSIISEAIHSISDFLASIIAFYSIKLASEPADTEHQYGHEKFEDLSGGIEGILILFAAGYIIYESIEKILLGSTVYMNTTIGILIMLISAIVNVFVSLHLFKIGEKTDSIALLADAQHLKADIYTSIGVLTGLVLIKFTGLFILDPIIAIIIALFILKTGFNLCTTSVKNLLDVSLPQEERKTIENIIQKYIPKEIIEVNGFKTRKAGPKKLVEFTLIVPASMTIKEGHDLCDKIEQNLESKLKNIDVTIHLEPCNAICPECILYHKDSMACYKLKFRNR